MDFTDMSVFVWDGVWICGDDGIWDLKLTKGQVRRVVRLHKQLKHHELLKQIKKLFNREREDVEMEVCYWSHGGSSFTTQADLPPVAIGSDTEVSHFLEILPYAPALNISVTFKAVKGYIPVEDEVEEATDEDVELIKRVEEIERLYNQQAAAKWKRPSLTYDTNPQEDGSPVKKMCYTSPSRSETMLKASEDVYESDEHDIGDNHEEAYDMALLPETTPKDSRRGNNGLINEVNEVQLRRDKGKGKEIIVYEDDIPPPPALKIGTSLMKDHNFGTSGIVKQLFKDTEPDGDNFDEINEKERRSDDSISNDRIEVKSVFEDKEALKLALGVNAMKNQYYYKTQKTDKGRLIAICKDPTCKWRVYATSHKDSENFEIRTAVLKHTCDISFRSQFGKKVTSKVIGKLIENKYANGRAGPRPCDIPNMLLSELNVHVTYMKSWYAREAATASARGSEEASYRDLATYLHLLKQSNPGTVVQLLTSIDSNGMDQFKYLFCSLGPCIEGWGLIRNVIVIDGTQLKGKYKGCLLSACGQDANLQIWPIAIGVVDSENEASWNWFLRQLTPIVPNDKNLVIVSDRHTSITAAVDHVYDKAEHTACIVHLCRNVKAKFKSGELADLVSKAARSYTLGDFNYWMKELKSRSPACAMFVSNIGLRHWTLAHCQGKRYNLMTSNVAESFNSAISPSLALPIVPMLEFIRTKIMGWFTTRRNLSTTTNTHCTQQIESILLANLRAATRCAVISASDWIYEVHDPFGRAFTVNLDEKTCTCNVFQTLMIPCKHALAATELMKVDIHSLVAKFYTTDTWRKLYAPVIMPVMSAEDTDIPESVRATQLAPPVTRRPPGRPRVVRIPSKGEFKKVKYTYITCPF